MPLAHRLRSTRWWVRLRPLRSLLRGGEQREAAVALLLRPRGLFQPWTTTDRDRYPDELACVRESLLAERREAPRVLSFGCASGEEVLTLREQWPAADITGIDINPLALRTARRKLRVARVEATLLRAADADGLPPASYDVVLALAVFRHGELNAGPPTCAPTLRFADFERVVTGLCRTVAPGGLMVVRHANFRFSDVPAAAGFEPVRTGFTSVSAQGEPTPVYGPDDRLLPAEQRDDGVYRRV